MSPDGFSEYCSRLALESYEPAPSFMEAHRSLDRSMAAMARDVGITEAQLMATFPRWPKRVRHHLDMAVVAHYIGFN